MKGIYKITETATGKCYIGQSVCIERRFKEHQKKRPLDLFSYEVVQECCDGLLDIMERFFIKKWNTLAPSGLNRTTGGTGKFGHMDEEHKQKISIANKGKPSKLRGASLSEEHKQNISLARKGWNYSEETKKKLSDAHIGKSSWNKGKRLNKETGKYEVSHSDS